MRAALQDAGERLLAALVRVVFAGLRALGPDRASDLGAAVAPRLGPLTRNHRYAMENLRLAFHEGKVEGGVSDALDQAFEMFPKLREQRYRRWEKAGLLPHQVDPYAPRDPKDRDDERR